MKNARNLLAARYQKALRAHLHRTLDHPRTAARALGDSALRQSMSTLDLAIMHERAMVDLTGSFNFDNARNRSLKKACGFFALALAPIEKHQSDTQKRNRRLREHNTLLQLHAKELASSNRVMQRENLLRKKAELVVLQSKEKYRILFLQSTVMQQQLRKLTGKILTAQEDERKAISRELHDQVVQTLVGINVELAALGRGASLNLRALKSKISHTQRIVEHSVREVHRFARDLRPAALDDLGLIPALRTFGKNLSLRKKIKIEIITFNGVEDLSITHRTVLFRVAQEALTNAARHARASVVKVVFTRWRHCMRMEVADNGKSFLADKVLTAPNPKRLGLVGMRERVVMAGGTLVIESTPGNGTVVRADIPFKPDTPTP
jgi:signal transduction histidine kinase